MLPCPRIFVVLPRTRDAGCAFAVCLEQRSLTLLASAPTHTIVMASASKSTTIINVSGESTIYRSAERCEVSLRISHTSTDQSDCLKRVTSLTNELSTHLKTLAPKDKQGQATSNAPVTWFEMSSLNSTSWIPNEYSQPRTGRQDKDKDKEELKRRYRTVTDFKVKFRDFKKLSEVLGDLGVGPHRARSPCMKLMLKTPNRNAKMSM